MPRTIRTMRVRTTAVITGDSIQTRPSGVMLKTLGVIMGGHIECRLYGIDAPELQQDYGTEARDKLETLLGNKPVWMDILGYDMHKRAITLLYFNRDDPADSLNAQMVRHGHAYWNESLAPDDDDLATAQSEARSNSRGVWGLPSDQEFPWVWRRVHRQRETTATRPIRGLWKIVAAAAFFAFMGIDIMVFDQMITTSISTGIRHIIDMIA